MIDRTQYPTECVHNKELGPNIIEVRLRRTDDSDHKFIPGQFLNVHFPNDEGELVQRSYSISSMSSPAGDADYFDVALALVEGGLASRVFKALKPGDAMTVSGPFGRLVLKEPHPKRYILISTGTGVAPYRSMIEQIKTLPESTSTIVVQGVRLPEDCLYSEDFIKTSQENDNFKFKACYSQVADTADLAEHEYKGRVQVALDELNLNAEHDICYLCGNPAMVDEVFKNLKEIGFNNRNVRREKYVFSR